MAGLREPGSSFPNLNFDKKLRHVLERLLQISMPRPPMHTAKSDPAVSAPSYAILPWNTPPKPSGFDLSKKTQQWASATAASWMKSLKWARMFSNQWYIESFHFTTGSQNEHMFSLSAVNWLRVQFPIIPSTSSSKLFLLFGTESGTLRGVCLLPAEL